MMDSISKTSQRTLTVCALFFSLCFTGRCFQVFVLFLLHFQAEVLFAQTKVNAFSRARRFKREKSPRKYT